MSKKCYDLDKKKGEKHTLMWYAFYNFRGRDLRTEKEKAGDSPGF